MWEQIKKEVDLFSKLHTEYAGTAWNLGLTLTPEPIN